jgi:hypothetical protein
VRFTTAADLVMTLETAQRQGRWKEAMHRTVHAGRPALRSYWRRLGAASQPLRAVVACALPVDTQQFPESAIIAFTVTSDFAVFVCFNMVLTLPEAHLHRFRDFAA